MKGVDRWGAELPSAYQSAVTFADGADANLIVLADLLLELGAKDEADKARSLAGEFRRLLPDVKKLGPVVKDLYPRLASKRVEENARKNEARVAREKAESLDQLRRQRDGETAQPPAPPPAYRRGI